VADIAPSRAFEATDGDAVVTAAAAAGDGQAFDELYRRHHQAALRAAMATLRNADDARDAVAEAFTRVFRALPEARSFRAYLLVTVRNCAVDIVRRAERRERAEAAGMPAMDGGDSVADHLVAEEDERIVVLAFAQLPARWQQALWLIDVERVSTEEAATALGVSANNAAQLASRARVRLREHYLQAHVPNHIRPRCTVTVASLGSFVAGTASSRARRKVDAHLATCGECRARVAELRDVGSVLRRSVLPLPLLWAGAEGGRSRGRLGAVLDRLMGSAMHSPAGRSMGTLLPEATTATPLLERLVAGTTAVVLAAGLSTVALGGSGGKARGRDHAGAATAATASAGGGGGPVLPAGEPRPRPLVERLTGGGLNLSGADLSGADLSGAALSGADLSGADLSGADLSGADLSGADLSGADLSGADLSGARMTAANLAGALLTAARLPAADLSGAVLTAAHLPNANLSGATLSMADLSGAVLTAARLPNANLSGADLSSADLSGALLSGARLTDADLSKADLSSASLAGAILSGARLPNADLSKDDLSSADLSKADLSSANLSGAILSGARLPNADVPAPAPVMGPPVATGAPASLAAVLGIAPSGAGPSPLTLPALAPLAAPVPSVPTLSEGLLATPGSVLPAPVLPSLLPPSALPNLPIRGLSVVPSLPLPPMSVPSAPLPTPLPAAALAPLPLRGPTAGPSGSPVPATSTPPVPTSLPALAPTVLPALPPLPPVVPVAPLLSATGLATVTGPLGLHQH